MSKKPEFFYFKPSFTQPGHINYGKNNDND